MPRAREEVLRAFVPADADFARGLDAPVDDFRPPVAPLEPELADLARVRGDFALAALRVLEGLVREAADLERDALVFRAPPARDEEDEVELELVFVLALPSIVHLPDITRWAASATASAISEPSLVALATTLLAAWLAVSAASRPASRIARRAFGLALIAAAAAANPAASISLLIAAFANLSTASLFEVDPVEPLRADLAITSSPSLRQKTLYARNGSRMKPEMRENPDMLKGTAAQRSDALRHGQRPEVWPFVST